MLINEFDCEMVVRKKEWGVAKKRISRR